MKIVILDGYTLNPGDLSWNALEALGELTVYNRTPLTDEDESIHRIGDAEVVFTNKTPLSARVFQMSKSLRYVGVLATGYNVVDTAAAKARGVKVTNIPSYGTAAVAQFAIALLLEICHHIGHHDRAVHEGRWAQGPDWCFWDYPLIELDGKTMGIIGFGRIGQATARIAHLLVSLRMPSGVAPALVLEPVNAALLAAKILGQQDSAVLQAVTAYQAGQIEKILTDDAGHDAVPTLQWPDARGSAGEDQVARLQFVVRRQLRDDLRNAPDQLRERRILAALAIDLEPDAPAVDVSGVSDGPDRRYRRRLQLPPPPPGCLASPASAFRPACSPAPAFLRKPPGWPGPVHRRPCSALPRSQPCRRPAA